MNDAIKIPKGATPKERDEYLSKMADDRIKAMFKRSPKFHQSILRLWSRNGVKVKDGYRVD